MSELDIAEEIRATFPGTEEIVVQYLSGYLVDDAGEDEDILQIGRYILESIAGDEQRQQLEDLMRKLEALLDDQLKARQKSRTQPKLQKLDKVMDMSKTALSKTLVMNEAVDLESVNKGK
jgi:ATP-binding cassette, subfamily F, member 3